MSQAAVSALDRIDPVSLVFADDGLIPNNPRLPFVLYPRAIAANGHTDPAAAFERAFAANGWRDSWRNGIYEFVHFHSMIHEVLGIARGRARVRFGGKFGRELDIE